MTPRLWWALGKALFDGLMFAITAACYWIAVWMIWTSVTRYAPGVKMIPVNEAIGIACVLALCARMSYGCNREVFKEQEG